MNEENPRGPVDADAPGPADVPAMDQAADRHPSPQQTAEPAPSDGTADVAATEPAEPATTDDPGCAGAEGEPDAPTDSAEGDASASGAEDPSDGDADRTQRLGAESSPTERVLVSAYADVPTDADETRAMPAVDGDASEPTWSAGARSASDRTRAIPAIPPMPVPGSQLAGATKAFKMPPNRGAEGRRSQRSQQPRYQQAAPRSGGVPPMRTPGDSPVRPVEWAGAHGSHRAGASRKKRSVPKVILLTLLAIVCVLGASYSAVALYFSDRFLPNTTIGKVDVSLMSAADAQKALSSSVANYTLNISGMGFDRTLNATDTGLSVDTWDVVDTALSHQDNWKWLEEWNERHDETDVLVATSNEVGLSDSVRSLVASFNDTVQAPTDAGLAYDSAQEAFVVTKESVGQALDADAVIAEADKAIAGLKPSITLTEDFLLQPTVYSDDERLNTAVAEANAIVGSKLTFTMADTEVATLGPGELTEWITLGDDLKPTLRDEEVDAWAAEQAEELNTVGTRRTYTRPDGKQFTVEGGVYGWEIDTEQLANQVKDVLKGGEAVESTIVMPTSVTGYAYTEPGGQDWGKKYLDIDLTEQHVRFYDDDGKLVWESDCVSGTPDGKHDTSTGVFWLNKKESPSKLIGYDSDGKKEYETEVTYWMPFDGNGIGVHDADWQPEFGGERYKEGYGSHGCVNVPKDKARELYDLIQYSDVVVSHY